MKQKKIRKTSKLVFIIIISVISFIFATYAWFVGITKVTVEEFKVNIKSSDGLMISLDGKDFESEVNVGEYEITDDLIDYRNNSNSWLKDNYFRPVSSSGNMTSSSRLEMFQKQSMFWKKNGYELVTRSIDNSSNEKEGYVAFDLFLKNQTSDKNVIYSNNYDNSNDNPIYLTYDSKVVIDEETDGGEGIGNSIRIAMMQIGRTPINTDYEDVQKLSCSGSIGTSLCNKPMGETWNIWEPNDMAHTIKSINHFEKFCFKRIGLNSYSGNCDRFLEDDYVDTYTVNSVVSQSDKVNIYDGLNGYYSNKLTKLDTLTDSEKIKTYHDRKELFYLAPNSITKIRVYIYMEGQDVDNFDFGSIERKLFINFGFTKDKFEEVE